MFNYLIGNFGIIYFCDWCIDWVLIKMSCIFDVIERFFFWYWRRWILVFKVWIILILGCRIGKCVVIYFF